MKVKVIFIFCLLFLVFGNCFADYAAIQDQAQAGPVLLSQKSPGAKISSPYGEVTEKEKVAFAVASGVAAIFMLFFALAIYIYSAICLQFIAKKTNTSPAWLSWIPIANIFLMCKIASVSFWWLLILFVAWIPVIGAIILAVFFGYLWYKIALVLKKPGWVGALCVLPLVNLVIMGYLAFSSEQ